jgi:ATP-binding protein involved in chromosome partitioning
MLRAMTTTPAPSGPSATPKEIAQKSASELLIRWADGAESVYEVRALRLACGCAACIDEWSGKNTLDPASVPADVHPVKIESVGRYAIQIEWSDGHMTGIYPFERLRALDDSKSSNTSSAESEGTP